jgi:hypothetical protein
MGLMIVGKLVRLAQGNFSESDLIQVQDSEEVVSAPTLAVDPTQKADK